MKRKKKTKLKKPTQLVEEFSKSIATILLDMGLYPGTDDFDEMYECLINTFSEEIKSNVIKTIRKTIDS